MASAPMIPRPLAARGAFDQLNRCQDAAFETCAELAQAAGGLDDYARLDQQESRLEQTARRGQRALIQQLRQHPQNDLADLATLAERIDRCYRAAEQLDRQQAEIAAQATYRVGRAGGFARNVSAAIERARQAIAALLPGGRDNQQRAVEHGR